MLDDLNVRIPLPALVNRGHFRSLLGHLLLYDLHFLNTLLGLNFSSLGDNSLGSTPLTIRVELSNSSFLSD